LYYFCSTDTNLIRLNIVRVTILQTDIKQADSSVNRNNACRLLAKALRSDIYVLPEMWPTGFITDSALMAECSEETDRQSSLSLKWMSDMAAQSGGAVSGSISVKDADGRHYNRLYFVQPNGETACYDKRHLFAYGGEDKHYEKGTKRVIVSYGGFRILLATCYDLRFPVWLRNKGDYDAMLLVADWPDGRREVWQTLLRARAIENQCFVIGANGAGGGRCGNSAIIDSKGRTLAEAADDKEQTITADLDLESQNKFRAKFPVLDDRDDFLLNNEKTINMI